MKKNVIVLTCLLFFVIFYACEKEDNNAAYTGLWETEVNNAVDPITQAAIKQKIEFDFDPDAFEALVFIGQSEAFMINQLGVRGLLDNQTDSTLSAELNEIGILTQTSLTWYAKDDPEEAALFDQYIQMISNIIPAQFDAIYKVEGNKLDLVIPAINDTIHLFKK